MKRLFIKILSNKLNIFEKNDFHKILFIIKYKSRKIVINK